MEPMGIERHGRSPQGELSRESESIEAQAISAKPAGVRAASQRLIPTGERSGLQTHIATGNVTLCVQMNCGLRFWNYSGDSSSARIVTKADCAAPRFSTQRAGIAPPHAEGEGLSGATSDRESNAFFSVPAGVAGGVPLTRARNPWAMPEAST